MPCTVTVSESGARPGSVLNTGLVSSALPKVMAASCCERLGVNALTVVSGEVRSDALGVELLDESSAQVLQRLATYEVDVSRLGVGIGGGGLGVDKHLLNDVSRNGVRQKCSWGVAGSDEF